MANKSLGLIISEARKAAAMSLRDLAQRVGVNHSYISDIEYGRRIPSERVLKSIAAQLGLNADALLSLAGRLGEKSDDYIRKHPQSAMLFRTIAENNLSDDALTVLINEAKRLSKKK